MMAVGCSPEAAKALMAETNLGAQLTVACVNSRSNVTLSGDVEALEALPSRPRRAQRLCSAAEGRGCIPFFSHPWNYSQIFRADSRIQCELVAQKLPTKSIVGAEMPSMEESERVWRGFIRLEEEPWLRDHAVGNNALFPGAGVISVVFEAAQQMVEPCKTARAYTLRDVSFTALMALSEGVATEVEQNASRLGHMLFVWLGL